MKLNSVILNLVFYAFYANIMVNFVVSEKPMSYNERRAHKTYLMINKKPEKFRNTVSITNQRNGLNRISQEQRYSNASNGDNPLEKTARGRSFGNNFVKNVNNSWPSIKKAVEHTLKRHRKNKYMQIGHQRGFRTDNSLERSFFAPPPKPPPKPTKVPEQCKAVQVCSNDCWYKGKKVSCDLFNPDTRKSSKDCCKDVPEVCMGYCSLALSNSIDERAITGICEKWIFVINKCKDETSSMTTESTDLSSSPTKPATTEYTTSGRYTSTGFPELIGKVRSLLPVCLYSVRL